MLPLYTGMAMGWFLPFWFRQKTYDRNLLVLFACCGWGLGLAGLILPDAAFSTHLELWIWSALGLLALPSTVGLCIAIWNKVKASADLVLLLAWCGGTALFQIMVAAYAAPRYVWPLMGVLFVMALRAIPLGSKTKFIAPVTVLGSVLFGLMVAWAEKEYADLQRIDVLVFESQPETLYFVGEKGMKYYGERAGYHYLRPELADRVGYLLVPEEIDRIPVPSELMEDAALIQSITVESAFPLRTMNRESGAGFYIHTRGPLPFAFSRKKLDTFHLYRVLHLGNRDWLEGEEQAYKSVGNILPDRPVYQDFQCLKNGLMSVRLNLATHARINQSRLIVRLEERDGSGDPNLVFEENLDAAKLQDNSWIQLDFEPQDSLGKMYRIQLSSPDATPGSAVTIWTNALADDHYFIGDEKMKGALGFTTLCSPGSGPKP